MLKSKSVILNIYNVSLVILYLDKINSFCDHNLFQTQ